MNKDPRNGFDRKGLSFIAKTFIAITLLVVSTKLIAGGAGVFLLSVADNTALAESSGGLRASVSDHALGDGAIEQGKSKTGLITRINQARGVEVADTAPPQISASAYIVADVASGQVYAEHNSDQIRPIASISKLMTSLVASDTLSNDRQITVSNNAANSYGNMAKFKSGEIISITDIMYPMLLYSANDAAISIGDYFNEGHFKNLMNKQARALGMTRTNFVEPSGLSSENVSTASDIFKLAKYIHEQKSFIFDLTRVESKVIQTNQDQYTFRNIHQLRNIEGYLGGKNGYISASGGTLLTLLEVKDSDGDIRTVAIVVLGSDNSAGDSLALLSWIKRVL